MDELVWDQGMSVGIESLDNDHKQLIAVLAQLMAANNDNLQQDSINEIFGKLELYCLSHFAREEALLAKVGYNELDAHKKNHQKFIEKIPELKKQWFADVSDLGVIKEQIIFFLQQWLVKHILEDDLDYVSAVHSHREFNRYEKNKKSKNPLIRCCSIKLSQYLTLSHRVFITTLIPAIATLFLCLIILKDNYQRHQTINDFLGLNMVIEQVNGINHSLQAERGLSIGYSSSNYSKFVSQLAQRRETTDKKISYFLWLLEQPTHTEIKKSISGYMFEVERTVVNLSGYRMQLDQKLVSFEDTYHAYTQLIEQLLSVSDQLVHIEIGSSYSNDIAAINAVSRYKEFMGKIRAMGMGMIEKNQQHIYDDIEVSLLIGQQMNTLRTFANSANTIQINRCGEYCNMASQRNFLEFSYRNVMDLTDKDIRTAKWFKVMSDKVNNLNIMVEGLISEFDNKIARESKRLRQDSFLIFFLLSLFILAAIFFALVLNYSIISPVRKLTYALNEMSEGQHNIHFNHVTSKDEIGSMQVGYEKLRRKLLQGDIYKATVSQQQQEIKYRKSQQDHFQHLALTDALTGAVNRLHFNEVLEQEILSVNRHGRPLSIMVLDIDHFKKINDSYGHGVGDEVLVLFYQACFDAVRSSDVVARIGGEEFVIIMPNTELGNAEKFAERLCDKIAQLEINIANQKISMTVSIGVSQWKNEHFTSAETFVAHADKSLYQAKNSGRNKVVVAQT